MGISSKRFSMGFRIAALVFALLLVAPLAFSEGQREGAEEEEITLATAIRSLENPYHKVWAEGGDGYAESVGLPHEVLTSEGSSEKQFNDIRALVGRTNGNVVFCIDPNESPILVPISQTLEERGVYYVTWWNKPRDLDVVGHPHWVAHMAFDGIEAGKFTARALIETFDDPNNGKIIALQGLLGNSIGVDRFQGLNDVLDETPGVEMVAHEAADWNRNTAFEKTTSMLAAHPDIDGIWAANDNMALGAIEALRSAGLAGEVMVTGVDGIGEMIEEIQNGNAAATVYNDSYWQAGIGLSMALAAARGELNVQELPERHRAFFVQAVNVSQDNVDDFVRDYIEGTPEYDWNDYFGKFVRPME